MEMTVKRKVQPKPPLKLSYPIERITRLLNRFVHHFYSFKRSRLSKFLRNYDRLEVDFVSYKSDEYALQCTEAQSKVFLWQRKQNQYKNRKHTRGKVLMDVVKEAPIICKLKYNLRLVKSQNNVKTCWVIMMQAQKPLEATCTFVYGLKKDHKCKSESLLSKRPA